MIRDIHSSSPRRSIAIIRTLLRISTLSTGFTLCAISFSFAAKLFPFTKDLVKTTKSDLDRAVFPTRKLNGSGNLWLTPA